MNEIATSIESLLTRGYGSIFVFFPIAAITMSLTYLFLGESFVATELFKVATTNLAKNYTFAAWPTIALSVLFALGSSMVLDSLHKIAFDSLLRGNFCTFILSNINLPTSLDKTLFSLRGLAINKLAEDKKILEIDKDEIKKLDYYLYESIGGIVPLDTREYVNEARINGYISLSFQIILMAELLLRIHYSSPVGYEYFLLVVMIILGYVVGYEAINSIYKLRAIRLYTNYLMEVGVRKLS